MHAAVRCKTLQFKFSSQNSVVTLGVLMVLAEGGCLIEVSRAHARQFVAVFSTFMSLESSRRISTAQARRIWWAGADACRDCAFSGMVVTFRGRRKGNLVFWE